jgi:uncharacterized membrane protein (UPF0127 family)
MKYFGVRNVTRRTDLGRKVRIASSFLDRVIGLLATSSLGSEEGLWISPCKSIHTFFMRYPIDVLFLDAKGIVVNQSTVQPWRISGWHAKSRGVLELSAGTLKRTGTRVGDHIEMKELN